MDKQTMDSATHLAALLRIRLAGPTHVGTDGRMPRIAESHTTISRETIRDVITVLETVASPPDERIEVTAPWDTEPRYITVEKPASV